MRDLDRYLLFIEYFNRKKFMSAQSTLGEAWVKETGPEREFMGGLIQLAVSLFSLTEGNPRGAQKEFERAKVMLEPFGEQHEGIHVKKLLGDFENLFATQIQDDRGSEDYLRLCPSIDVTADWKETIGKPLPWRK